MVHSSCKQTILVFRPQVSRSIDYRTRYGQDQSMPSLARAQRSNTLPLADAILLALHFLVLLHALIVVTFLGHESSRAITRLDQAVELLIARGRDCGTNVDRIAVLRDCACDLR